MHPDLFIITALLIVAAYDIWLIIKHHPTISNRMLKWSRLFAAPAWSWAVLAGHFVSDSPVIVSRWFSVAMLFAVGLTVSLVNRFLVPRVWRTRWLGLVWVLVGVFSGYFLWGQ